MRNVLIPTDFSLESLRMVEDAAAALNDQTMNIVLFHAFETPSSEFDLLGGSKRAPYLDLLTDEFRNGCKRIKNAHSKTIQSINIRHCYGSNVAVFRNFVDANDIDLIIYPSGYSFVPVHASSVNPEKIFRKSGVPIVEEFNFSRGNTRTVQVANQNHQVEQANNDNEEYQFEPIPALARS